MAENKRTDIGDVVKQAKGLFAMNPLVAPQLEQFWKVQDGILDEAEAYSQAWFDRRHKATRSALDAARDAGGNGADGSTALHAITEWQRASMAVMAEDVQEWIDFCARCAGHLANAEMEAAKEGVDEAAKRAATQRKSRHATPV